MSETLNPYTTRPGDFLASAEKRMGYKIVAMVNAFKTGTGKATWCAYKGLTDWTDEQVAQQGDALTEEQALVLFPTMRFVEAVYVDY